MEKYYTIEVCMILNKEQHREYNKWACTIRGEERIVTQQVVCFLHPSLEDVHKSFNIDECESFTIKSLN